MNTSQVNFINTLDDRIEHWLPSRIDLYNNYNNQSRNRVEGYFGMLKKQLSHTIQL